MPGDGPGFFDRTLDVLRRGEAEDIVRQARVGGHLKGTVGKATVGVGGYGGSIPSGGWVGQVYPYSPHPGIVWLMYCGDDLGGGTMRWWVVGSAPIIVRNTGLVQTLTTTPATVAVEYAPAYAGGWEALIGSGDDMTNAAGTNGNTMLALCRNTDADQVAIEYGWMVQASHRQTPTTGVEPFTAAKNDVLRLYAWKSGTTTLRVIRPWMVLWCRYLDVPK